MPEKFPIKQISKILKTKIGRVFLSSLLVLSFLVSTLIINNINSQTSSPTKSCNDSAVSPEFTADKNNNCLVYLNGLSNGNGSTAEGISLPACTNNASSSSYRSSCADPIHFPLCNSIGENNNLKNCINECEPSKLDEHNISCIKFCDSLQKENCVDRKCHQPKELLSNDGSPTGTFEEPANCEKISCNLLTEGELSLIAKICNIYDLYKNPPTDVSKLSETDRVNLVNAGSCFEKHCKTEDSIGQKLRCYQYSVKQLPLTRILNCDLHSCNYENPNNKSEIVSEYDNIINKNNGYKALYCKNVKAINNEGCSEDSLSNFNATPRYCKNATILKFSYSCAKLNDSEVIPSLKNNECNTSCLQGSCFKEVVCDSNSSNPLCFPPVKEDDLMGGNIEQKIGSQDLLSFFNRPTPPASLYSGTYMKAINDKYKGGDAKNGAISSHFTFKCINQNGIESVATTQKCFSNSASNNFNENKDSYGNCCLNGERVKIDPIIDFVSRGSILDLGQTDACGTYYQQLGNGSYSPPYYPKNRYGSSYHNVGTGRGVGYIYLCGNGGILYNKVSEQTAYFKGYPQEVWSSDDVNGKRKIKVTVCLRYRNSFYPWGEDTCGARSCVRNCHFFKGTEKDLPCFEYCGDDVCKELEIDESNPEKCLMSDSFLAENTNECSKLIGSSGLADGYLRLRAVSYGDKVCAFLDVKGHTAYDDSIFIRPNDKIPMTQRDIERICKGQDLDKCIKANETCITGKNDGYGNCIGAFDTTANGKKGLADVFRPMLRVQYAGSLFGASKKVTGLANEVPGYYDVSGRFIEQMPCAPIEPRIAPPSQFNLANYQNSSKIFEPALYISGYTKSANNEKAVDFFEPEIQVTYGSTSLKLKLSKGIKEGVVIDKTQLVEEIQKGNKNCSYNNPNEVRLFGMEHLRKLGKNIDCSNLILDKPEYYKYIIDDISPFIKQIYKNQYSSFEINDNSGGRIISYTPSENEQLGKLIRNTYLRSGNNFNLTNNQVEDIRLQKSITLQTVFNQSAIKRVTVFLKRKESFNNPQICLMKREFFVMGDESSESSYQTKDYEVSCVPIDKTALNLVAYGKINGDDEKVDLGKYTVNGVNIIDEIGKIYANKKIYYRYAVSKNFNSNSNNLPNTNYYGDEYYLSSPQSYENSSCEVNSSLDLDENEEKILLGSDKYIICAQRSKCSSIYNECIASYIQKNRKELLQKDVAVENQAINSCKSLEDNCNSLMHFNDSNFPSPYSSESYKSYPRDNQYAGWFNEICLAKNGLNHLFSRKVVVYNKSGIEGKNSDSACVAKTANCTSGSCSCYDADGINCLCVEADLDESGNSKLPNQYSDVLKYDLREKTPHEAGFCVNMPILKSCPALIYKTDQERADASKFGNAEFNVSFPSMKKIKGECRGNWRSDPDSSKAVYGECNMLNVAGNIIEAENSSTEQYNSENNKVMFSKNNGSCIRYSCPEITAGRFSKPYPDIFTDILFPENSYAIYNPNFQVNDEIGDDVGKKLGFSNWQSYTKTKDGNEEVASSYSATIPYYNNSGETHKIYSCIPGYKIKDATPDRSDDYMSSKDLLLSNSIYKKIIGYSYLAINVPKRQCNDFGNWVGDVVNSCEPINCPAIKPNSPLEVGISSDEIKKRIAEWSHINGAEFTESLASRSVESGRVIYGSCNTEIGYQVMSGGKPPSRECDYLGNWGPIKNPCSGKCDAINSEIGNDVNNGYSEWLKVENVDNNQVKIISASKCIDGFYKYPYSTNKIFAKTNTFNLEINGQYSASALFDDVGDATIELKDRESSSSSATESVNNNGLPIRGCFNSSNEFSKFNSNSSARWLAPLSICINSCPSGDLDARIGIGVTEHDSSIGKVRIIWPSTNFGEEAVAYGKITDYVVRGGVKYLNASFSKSQLTSSQSIVDYIGSDRANGNYLIIRSCGNISSGMAGKWVSLNNGCASISSNSIQRTFSSSDNGVLVNEARSYISIGTNLNGVSCNNSQNYYNANKNTSSAPSYQCVNSSSGNIDKTYYSRVSSTNACAQYCQLAPNQNINGLESNNTSTIYLNSNETQSATCRGCGSSNNILCNASYQLNSTGDCHICRDCTSGSSYIEGNYTTGQDPDCSTTGAYGEYLCSEGGDEARFNYYDEVINANISHNSSANLSNRSETSCPIGGRYCGCNTKCPDIFATGNVSCYDGKKTVNSWSWINWRYI